MRRIIIIGTALAVLGAAGAAYAAFNNYNGSSLTISKGHKNTPLSMVEKLQANAPSGDRAAPLKNIKVTIYGVKLDVGKLPVCTDSKIAAQKTKPTGGCPAGSVIGGGRVHSLLGSGSNPSQSVGTPCNPYLNVFNGGPGKQIFYFYAKSISDCAGLTTGSTAPYDSTIKYSGKNAVINVPLPPDISTKVAGQNNLYGSLITEVLNFGKKVNGKVYMTGVACKGGKRPWSITFTAQDYGSTNTETQTVKGSSPC